MSFYLPNPAVRPTGCEVAEFVDAVPSEHPAVVDPPGTRADTPTAHDANPQLGVVVIVAGVVEEVEDLDGFLGELGLPVGEAFATAIVCEAGSVVVIPVDRLRSVVVRDAAVADVIMRAHLAPRSATS